MRIMWVGIVVIDSRLILIEVFDVEYGFGFFIKFDGFLLNIDLFNRKFFEWVF